MISNRGRGDEWEMKTEGNKTAEGSHMPYDSKCHELRRIISNQVYHNSKE